MDERVSPDAHVPNDHIGSRRAIRAIDSVRRKTQIAAFQRVSMVNQAAIF
jgi:hypothetical protein